VRVLVNFLKVLPLGVGLPVIILLLSTPPDAMASNISKWAKWAGAKEPPYWLATKSADHWIATATIVCALIYSLIVWRMFVARTARSASRVLHHLYHQSVTQREATLSMVVHHAPSHGGDVIMTGPFSVTGGAGGLEGSGGDVHIRGGDAYHGPVTIHHGGDRATSHSETPAFPKREIWLQDAVCRAIYGHWPTDDEQIFNQEGDVERVENVVRQMREFAGDGRLLIWGKSDAQRLFEQIPKSYWMDHKIEFLHLFGSAENVRTEKATHSANQIIFKSLMVCKSQIEALWPIEGHWD
jgi:hypothetical protein